eukprot:4602635-Lingulodinium_polyedra.AAC.1
MCGEAVGRSYRGRACAGRQVAVGFVERPRWPVFEGTPIAPPCPRARSQSCLSSLLRGACGAFCWQP